MNITIFTSGKIASTDDVPRLFDDLKRVAGDIKAPAMNRIYLIGKVVNKI